MKKTLIVTLVVVATLAVGATAVFAQGAQTVAQVSAWMGMGGRGGPHGLTDANDPLHTYYVAALASSLKLTSADLESRLAAGESLYDIAVAQGITVDKISTLLTDARTAAIDAAVKAGDITQVWADWMKSRQQDGFGGNGGLLYKYEVEALASAFKITTAEVEARLATGQSGYDIAVAKGIATDQISTVLTTAHTAAIDAALKDGIITQTQADAMKGNTRGFGFGHMDGGMHRHGMGNGPRGGQNVQP